jgi:hypothetical protein
MENRDKIENTFEKIVKAVNDLNEEVNAEMNHGVGFETKENREDFIKYFDAKFNEVSKQYFYLKVLLENE